VIGLGILGSIRRVALLALRDPIKLDMTMGIPVYVPVLLAAGIVAFIGLVMFGARRTRLTNEASRRSGVSVNGASASASFDWHGDHDALRRKISRLVESHPKYSKVETQPSKINVYIRPNIWTWGEVISIPLPEKMPTRIKVKCSPRLETTVYDYGQCGKDLVEFIELVK
jgi:hypothetical protein